MNTSSIFLDNCFIDIDTIADVYWFKEWIKITHIGLYVSIIRCDSELHRDELLEKINASSYIKC